MILLSLVFVVIELRKSFRQTNIANSLQQELGRSQIRYAQIEEGLAKLLAKAHGSSEDLKDFEKIQFDNYILQQIAVYAQIYRKADDAIYKLGADFMRTNV